VAFFDLEAAASLVDVAAASLEDVASVSLWDLPAAGGARLGNLIRQRLGRAE
jgi:hypothetical protein